MVDDSPHWHQKHRDARTIGERIADRVAEFGGSWMFIGLAALGIALWMATNGLGYDPPPWIGLNLLLSCLAAFQAPVILMSQGRADARDRHNAEEDAKVNREAEERIEALQRELARVEMERLATMASRVEEIAQRVGLTPRNEL